MIRTSPRQFSKIPLPSVPKSPSNVPIKSSTFTLKPNSKVKGNALLPTISNTNISPNIPILNLEKNQSQIRIPKRVSITVRNHNAHEDDYFPESPKLHGTMSTRKPNRKLPPNLEIQKPFVPRPSQFGLLVTGHSPFKIAESEKSPTSIAEKLATRRVSRLENLNYLTPTLASVRRMSCKVQKESPEKNFIFSKFQSPAHAYDCHAKEKSSGDKLSSDELSSALSGGSKSSASPLSVGIKPIKLEVTGTSVGTPQKAKSGFSRHQLLVKKSNPENTPVKESGKIEEVIEEEQKPIKKRISGIMSKELEQKYGIKLINSYSSDSENEENDEEIANNNYQINLSPLMKLAKDKADNSPSIQAKNEVVSEEVSDDEESTVQSTLQKMPYDKIEEMKRLELEDIKELIKKQKPLIATLGGRTVLQPQYMKKSGSMCFTELWSEKSNVKFYRMMKSDVPHVRVIDDKREHEYLYRPEKWRETETVKAKIQRIKHESDLENFKNVADSIARNSNLLKKASLPLLKLEASTSSNLGTPRSFRGEATPSTSSGQSPNPKNLGILANIVRNEKALKKSDFSKGRDTLKISETPRGSEFRNSPRRFF